MKKLLKWTAIAGLFGCAYAWAQGDIPQFSLPYSNGVGSQGWLSFGPCTTSQVTVWASGAAGPPSCGGAPTGFLATTAPISLSGTNTISLAIDNTFAVSAGNLALAAITSNFVIANTLPVTAEAKGVSVTTLLDVGIGSGSTAFLQRTTSQWVANALSGDVTALGTGAVTIATSAVTNAKLATANPNTVKSNFSNSAAAETDNTVPSCSTDGSHGLTFTNGSGFNCTTLNNGGTVTSISQDASTSVKLSTNPCTATCTVSAGSGNRVLINTLAPNNVATIGDTTSITATYNEYEIVLENVIPATTGAACQLQVHAAGNFQALNYTNTGIYNGGNGTVSALVGASTTAINCTSNTATDTSNGPSSLTNGISGTLKFFTPTSTTSAHTVTSQIGYRRSGTTDYGVMFAASDWASPVAIDGIQLSFGAGNISSGNIYIYGIVK